MSSDFCAIVDAPPASHCVLKSVKFTGGNLICGIETIVKPQFDSATGPKFSISDSK